MPTHYKGKTYLTFRGLMRAVARDHPSWPQERAARYAKGIETRQKAGKKGLPRVRRKKR